MPLSVQLPTLHLNEGVLLDSLPDCTRQNLRELDRELAEEQYVWERLLFRATTPGEARQIQEALLSSARVRAAIHQEQDRRWRLVYWRERFLTRQVTFLRRYFSC